MTVEAPHRCPVPRPNPEVLVSQKKASLRTRLLGLVVSLQSRLLDDEDRQRGDIPGWVLITIMTAGLVSVLYGVARDQLSTILTNALNSVTKG